MIKPALIFFPVLLSLFFRSASPAEAVGISVNSGLNYQNRNFKEGSLEYDLDYWSFFVKPTLRITDRWSIFARLAYSRVQFDRPRFGATDYDQWGPEFGGGTGYTIFKWSGLYAKVEGEISQDNSRHDLSGGREEKCRILFLDLSAQAGWDFPIASPYIGIAYADGWISYRYSSSAENYSDHYRLEDPWKTFVGGTINIPPLSHIQGRYYFGRDVLAVLSMGIDF
jgi:hypothetical protein